MTAVAGPTPAVAASVDGDLVALRFEDGTGVRLHRFALRDACPCGLCRHPVSGQRLFESGDVVPGARVSSLRIERGRLRIEWEDGHRSEFEERWLAEEAAASAVGVRQSPEPTLWGAELGAARPVESYDNVVSDPAALRRWLGAVAEYGFAVLTGAPTEEGTVAAVAELFGHVRTTNYGRVFDVEARVDATNLADTSAPLSLHTDNPYRNPAPTLQLLQCLASNVSGGETVIADGFRAVALLREHSPQVLATLARTPIRFAYRDATAELAADVPVLVLDAAGFPVAVHVNNRSKGVPPGVPKRVAEWYSAYFELVRLLDDPAAHVVFRLDPGDVVILDNLRVLHARTGFSSEGTRRLQGCYADRDALLSTLAVLDRAGS